VRAVSPSPVGFGELAGLWEEGQRRLAAADPGTRPALERVTDELVLELRRRLGGTFTVDELAALYADGIDWCFQIAARLAPSTPEAWDLTIVGGAAFLRYAREAVDYSLGRRIAGDG
jgi:hypothetical protein